MNVGVISTRYAKAILWYASDLNEEEVLHKEMKTLSKHFFEFPLLNKILDDPTVSSEEKIKVLLTAGGENTSNIYRRVIQIVVENGRGHYMHNIALMYDKIYRKEKKIVNINLTTVIPVSQETEQNLMDLVVKDKQEKPNLTTKTDDNLIGGFILEVEDLRLDASLKNQLNQLRLELTKN